HLAGDALGDDVAGEALDLVLVARVRTQALEHRDEDALHFLAVVHAHEELARAIGRPVHLAEREREAEPLFGEAGAEGLRQIGHRLGIEDAAAVYPVEDLLAPIGGLTPRDEHFGPLFGEPLERVGGRSQGGARNRHSPDRSAATAAWQANARLISGGASLIMRLTPMRTALPL